MRPEWSIDQLAIALEQNEVLLVDVRPTEDVAAGHLPGSCLVPMAALAARLRDIDDPLHQRLTRDSPPVAVIAGDVTTREAAAAVFAEIGIESIGVAGEVRAWSRQGRPLNSGRDHNR